MLKFQGLDRVQATEAGPGDIVLINGIEDIGIGVTLTDMANPQPLPMLKIDEPTLTMNFCVNTSPLAGREGKFVTSRQIWDRLQKELQSNVALRVREPAKDGFGMHGSGMFVINPPWTLHDTLAGVMPYLVSTLGSDSGAGYVLEQSAA